MTEEKREMFYSLLRLIDKPGGSSLKVKINALILSEIKIITGEILKKHCL